MKTTLLSHTTSRGLLFSLCWMRLLAAEVAYCTIKTSRIKGSVSASHHPLLNSDLQSQLQHITTTSSQSVSWEICSELKQNKHGGNNRLFSLECWHYTANSGRMSACDGLHECSSIAQQSLWSGEANPRSRPLQTAAVSLRGPTALSTEFSSSLFRCLQKVKSSFE